MIGKKVVIITAVLLLILSAGYMGVRVLDNFFYPGDRQPRTDFDDYEEETDREVELRPDSETLGRDESNGQAEEPAEEEIVYREELWGYTATAEYLGNRVWSYEVSGELPNRCYEYDYQLIKTGADPDEPVGDFDRADLELTISVPEEICQSDAEPLSIEGRYQAPSETAFVFLVDIPVAPIVKTEAGFTARARYVDRDRWRYQLEGELPNDCWELELALTVDGDSQLEEVELDLRLIEPASSVACQSPWSVTEEGEYVAGPQADLSFTVIEEMTEETAQEEDEPDEDSAETENDR